jgi:hypothetical protein
VGVCERNASLREPVHVRRFDLWVPAEEPDPVVQIVYRDKQHVRLGGPRDADPGADKYY